MVTLAIILFELETSQLFVGIDLISKRIEKSESKKSKTKVKKYFFTRLKLMNLSNMPDSQLKIHILCIQILGQSLNIIKDDLFNYLFEVLASKTSQSGKLFFYDGSSRIFRLVKRYDIRI